MSRRMPGDVSTLAVVAACAAVLGIVAYAAVSGWIPATIHTDSDAWMIAAVPIFYLGIVVMDRLGDMLTELRAIRHAMEKK